MVVFIFMVRQEIVVFGRVEDWSVEFVEGILDAGAVVCLRMYSRVSNSFADCINMCVCM